MYNNEKKDDFQNLHDDWCEDWIEDWHEVWYDEESLEINQTPQDDYKKVQSSVNESIGDSDLDDVLKDHSIDEVSEYKEETIPNKDDQVKSKSNFIDYVDELETAINPQINVSE